MKAGSACFYAEKKGFMIHDFSKQRFPSIWEKSTL